MKRRITVERAELLEVLEKINRQQSKSGIFYNVRVVPYKGLKHPAEENTELFTIIIG